MPLPPPWSPPPRPCAVSSTQSPVSASGQADKQCSCYVSTHDSHVSSSYHCPAKPISSPSLSSLPVHRHYQSLWCDPGDETCLCSWGDFCLPVKPTTNYFGNKTHFYSFVIWIKIQFHGFISEKIICGNLQKSTCQVAHYLKTQREKTAKLGPEPRLPRPALGLPPTTLSSGCSGGGPADRINSTWSNKESHGPTR